MFEIAWDSFSHAPGLRKTEKVSSGLEHLQRHQYLVRYDVCREGDEISSLDFRYWEPSICCKACEAGNRHSKDFKIKNDSTSAASGDFKFLYIWFCINVATPKIFYIDVPEFLLSLAMNYWIFNNFLTSLNSVAILRLYWHSFDQGWQYCYAVFFQIRKLKDRFHVEQFNLPPLHVHAQVYSTDQKKDIELSE